MRIKKMLEQHRRDFVAIYECEHCGREETMNGYDDAHFHNVVIPKMECRTCGKIAHHSTKPRTPKYPDGMVI